MEDRHVVVRGASGEKRITGKQAKSFDVLERRPVEVAPGDRLVITANRHEAGLRVINGEIAIVSRIATDGRIQLEDGRTLPADFK